MRKCDDELKFRVDIRYSQKLLNTRSCRSESRLCDLPDLPSAGVFHDMICLYSHAPTFWTGQ